MNGITYEEIFERNYGIFDPAEQERIRNSKVVIVGCGGIGGVVAIALARSGVEHLVLLEHDIYQVSNMNRQITCFTDTMGVNKASCVKECILKINPFAEVVIHEEGLTPDRIDEFVLLGDVIIPAADDWALSIVTLGRAKELKKPAVMAYPVGALGRVSTFLPESPYAAECLAMPYNMPYAELKAFMDSPDNRRILHYYRSEGAWREEWFDEWCESRRPHAQLCTTVWITGTLAAQEILKLISKKWKPIVAPHYWRITPTSACIARFGLGRRLLSRLSRRPIGQKMLPFMARRPWLVKLFTRLIS